MSAPHRFFLEVFDPQEEVCAENAHKYLGMLAEFAGKEFKHLSIESKGHYADNLHSGLVQFTMDIEQPPLFNFGVLLFNVLGHSPAAMEALLVLVEKSLISNILRNNPKFYEADTAIIARVNVSAEMIANMEHLILDKGQIQ